MPDLDVFAPFIDFKARVDSQLAKSGWRYASEAKIRGVEADFLVWAPDEESFVLIELKFLTHDSDQLSRRAAELALRTRDVLGARAAFLVTPHEVVGAEAIESGQLHVVSEATLLSTLRAELGMPRPEAARSGPDASAKPLGFLFAAMPFAKEFDDVFFVAIVGAADRLGLVARRVDYEDFSGDVVARIKDSIRESRAVVVDLTNQRPNVLYEMGYAHALEKLVLPICSGDLGQLPFDVAHEKTLPYEKGRTNLLKDRLAERLGALLS